MGMTAPALLARGRAAAQRLMLDTVTITRVTGRVFDPVGGQYADTTATVYTGPADVKPRDQVARGQEAGETDVSVSAYDVKLPWAASASVRVEDRVTATASPDPRLVDRPLLVTGVGLGARRTAWHLTAVDQEAP